MSQTQPGAVLYTAGFGSRPENVEVPVIQTRAPATTDNNYVIGKDWVDTTNNAAYKLTSISTAGGVKSGNWQLLGSASGSVSSVLGTANQVTVSTAANVATVSIPSTFIAPGTLTVTDLSSLDGGAEINGPFTVTTTGSDDIILTSADAITINSAGTTQFNSSDSISLNSASNSNFTVTGGFGLDLGSTGGGVTLFSGWNDSAAVTISAASGGINLTSGTGTSVTGSLTVSTSLTATLGAITATNGNLVLGTAGNKIAIATGSNASVGTSAAMGSGTVIISTTAVSASSIIFLTVNTPGGTPGILSVGTITAGTSFVINSSEAGDTSTVNWLIIN